MRGMPRSCPRPFAVGVQLLKNLPITGEGAGSARKRVVKQKTGRWRVREPPHSELKLKTGQHVFRLVSKRPQELHKPPFSGAEEAEDGLREQSHSGSRSSVGRRRKGEGCGSPGHRVWHCVQMSGKAYNDKEMIFRGLFVSSVCQWCKYKLLSWYQVRLG